MFMFGQRLQDTTLSMIFQPIAGAVSSIDLLPKQPNTGESLLLSYHAASPFKAAVVSKGEGQTYNVLFLKQAERFEGEKILIPSDRLFKGIEVQGLLNSPFLPLMENQASIGPLDQSQVASLLQAAVLHNYACQAAAMQSDLLNDLKLPPMKKTGPDYTP